MAEIQCINQAAHTADSSAIPTRRLRILNEANWQTEQVLRALIRSVEDHDVDGLPALGRSLGMRLQQLNNVSMWACCEDKPDIAALEADLGIGGPNNA